MTSNRNNHNQKKKKKKLRENALRNTKQAAAKKRFLSKYANATIWQQRPHQIASADTRALRQKGITL